MIVGAEKMVVSDITKLKKWISIGFSILIYICGFHRRPETMSVMLFYMVAYLMVGNETQYLTYSG